jgi:carbamoyl-phosphate synthase large subunit
VLVQFGGQTPLKLARRSRRRATRSGDVARVDRPRRGPRPLRRLLDELGLAAPAHAEARDAGEAVEAARRIGYPLVVRPSYVLGGRAMAIVFDERTSATYVARAVASSPSTRC